ncbi:MAG: hypothetical protein LBC60_08595 [Spirochaetaceae bacterium]|nr:hypothetical protein [Spirochaetaceae bacterium]
MKKVSKMSKFIILVFVLFFIDISSVYCESLGNNNVDQNVNTPRIFYMPMLSYTFFDFGDIQSHNAMGGLSLYRFNPNERDKLFSVSLIYNPQILTGIPSDFPNLYHTAALSITQKINRHKIDGTFIALTDKPLYGGLHTFIGMAGYSYALIKGAHFSMDFDVKLLVMDVGLTLDNGMPWLLWPVPSINLSWEYEWITFGFIPPGLWLTIGPKFPVSLILKTGSYNYDASLWYRHFKNGNPLAEMVGIGIGVKRDSSDMMISDGGKYGINYDAIYGTFRLLRLFEISGGWIFNVKDEYKKINWQTLFESDDYSDDSMYSGNIGNGFFVSISISMNL